MSSESEYISIIILIELSVIDDISIIYSNKLLWIVFSVIVLLEELI